MQKHIRRGTRRGIAGVLLAVGGAVSGVLSPLTAQAQTWSGASSTLWSTGSNWAGLSAPTSATTTILTFGAAPNYSSNNNIAGAFQLNQLTFAATAASPYSLTGNALDFRSNGATGPVLQNVSAQNVSIANNLALTASITDIQVLSTGNMTLSGAISGAGGLSKSGAGTLVLAGSVANTFGSGMLLFGGTIALTNPSAISAGLTLQIFNGSTFRLDYLSGGNSAAPLGTLYIGTGTFRVPSGTADYYVNHLESNGGAIDFTGSSNFWLHLTGASADVKVTADATWTGGGTSNIRNDTAGVIDFTVSSGKTLTNGIPLALSNQGFRLTGGGTVKQTASGSNAPVTVDGANYRFADPNYLTSGSLTLSNVGALVYDGFGASSNFKPISLGPAGGKLVGLTAALDQGGVISGVAGAPLYTDGIVFLTNTNTYTGKTELVGGTLDLDSIANGGVASRIGASSLGSFNLVIDNATLRYSGTSATTDRGFTVTRQLSTVNVSNAAANLTFGGQVTGSGSLTKAGSGTLTLSNASNNWNATTSANVDQGTLAITSPTAIPSGGIVNVNPGASFRIDYTSGANNSAPLGRLQLYGGTFRVPSGSGAYYTNHLFSQIGGAVDLSGTSGFQLVLTGAGADITLTGNATWLGGGLSSIRNNNASMIDLNIPAGVTLTNGIPLNAGGSGQGFKITGGGTLVQTAGISTAPLTIAGFSFLQFSDPMYAATAGTLTLQDFSALIYTGVTNANLPKAITLAGGGGQVQTFGTELTFPGVISESSAGQSFYVFGGAVLTANNTYTGKTGIYAGSTLKIASIPNAGLAGPLGQSTAAPANLDISGTLGYTGTSATTNRGFTVAAAGSAIDVASGATDLSFTGQVTGAGGLNKNGPGKLTLISSNNNYTGPTTINAGTLSIEGTGALPGGKNVTVNSGATLQLGINVNNSGNAIGTITLNAGTLRVPSGLSDYYINQLNCNGGTVDFSGSTAFWLHPVNAGASINVTADTVWIGGGSSNIRNDENIMDINIAAGKTANSTIPLDRGTNGLGIRIAGGGTLLQQAGGSDSIITVDASHLQIVDPSHLTSGTLVLQDFGSLEYVGVPAATVTKPIVLNAGGGRIQTESAALTMAGLINETGPGQRLDIVGNNGPAVILAADNTYSGRTTLLSLSTVSVATIPNGGIPGPLGKSSADPANLVLTGSKLQYTGGSAATDRGFTTNGTFAGVIEVASPAADLTFSGQIVGTGGLAKTGPGTLTMVNPLHTSSTLVSAGTLRFQSSFTAAPAYSLFLSGSGILELASGGGSNRVIRAALVLVSGTSKLDLRDNKLILAFPAGSWTGSNYTGVTGLIKAGRNGGGWGGSGIVTSLTQATTSNFTTIGVATASQAKGIASTSTAVWGGQTVSGTNTLVMYTYGGDANLDGKINVDDYTRIDFNVALGTTGWYNGDFNYDGKVNVDDYTIIDFNVGIQGAPFATGPQAGGLPGEVGGLSAVAVPEPGALSLMCAGAMMLGARRRRSRR